jgi:hypothetical protein
VLLLQLRRTQEYEMITQCTYGGVSLLQWDDGCTLLTSLGGGGGGGGGGVLSHFLGDVVVVVV